MLIDFRDSSLQALVEPSRPLHEALAATFDRSAPDLSTPEGLALARKKADAFTSLSPDDLSVPAEVRSVHVAGRTVDVRVVRPAGEVRGVYLDVHGGGFYLGSASMSDKRNHELCTSCNLAVVSVEYRLAPEHPWPAGPDDCETAALWLLEEAVAEFGEGRLAIGGGSAGATLAAVTLLRMRDRHDAVDRFVGANLVYGVYDLSGMSPSGRSMVDARRYYLDAYLRDVPDAERTRPDVSPLFADLTGLPPALFSVGDLDALYEDNLAMAMRWAAAGGETELVVYPECPHGFNSLPTPMAAEANRRIRQWIGELFR
jgi:acetyl esterase/lipase